jgi:hypothetical protein
MPTAITTYILTPSSGPLVQVDISGTAYASYQVYADNALVTEQRVASFAVVLLPNQKIDVLGLVIGERGQNFSSTLSDSQGDKVVVSVPQSALGLPLRVYFDGGSGIIDYGRAIADVILTAGSPTTGGFGLSSYGAALGFGFGPFGSSATVLTLTHRLQAGTYKFAVVNYTNADNFHAPTITTVTVATRPDETTPTIVGYDAATDRLTVAV